MEQPTGDGKIQAEITGGSSQYQHKHKYFSVITADEFPVYVRNLNQGLQRLKSSLENEVDSGNCDILITATDYVKLKYSDQQKGGSSADMDYFPVHLLQQFTEIVRDPPSTRQYSNTFDIPIPLNVSLCLISEWLGKELCKMSSVIAQKVEHFKTEHIDSIDDLPPAHELIEELFPGCMIVLLLHWIGSKDEVTPTYPVQDHSTSLSISASQTKDITQQCTSIKFVPETIEGAQQNMHFKTASQSSEQVSSNVSNSFSNSTWTEPVKRSRKRPFIDVEDPHKHPFSIIQLILEFANSALVSGVSHVVYSRLLH